MPEKQEFHVVPKRQFVELIVASPDGTALNTVCSENPELAALLVRMHEVAESTGAPIRRMEPMMALGQNVFSVDRSLVLSLLGCFYTKSWAELQALPRDLPETAVYTFVVSY